MAGERTFLVRLLGNADGAVAAFKKLGNEGEKTIKQLQTVGNAIGSGFDVVQRVALVAAGALTAVAGAASAAALAAAEDEQSQRLLASPLERTTGASSAQVEAVERFIKSAMLATGVADTDLRNGFANLTRATGDATQSQRLLTLSLDISAQTGLDLAAVTTAVGKAANGQVTALSKLGVPIDENTKKSKDFNSALEQLEAQFGGAAAESADTFSGRLKILQVSLGEVVESIGFALLPFFEKLVKFIQDNILPALIVFSDNVGEKGIVKSAAMAINAMGDMGISFIDTLEGMTLAVLNFLKEFADVGRTIALTVGFTAALTGNAVVAIKATAASLMFKAAQDKLNGALAATPGMFDRIRNSMAAAAAAQSKALPNIIGTADALERAIVKGKKDIVPTFTGVGASVKTTKELLDEYRKSVEKVVGEQKSLFSATKNVTAAKKQLGERIRDLDKRERDVGDRNLDLLKRQGDVVKRNLDITKRKGDIDKRNADIIKKEGDLIKRNIQLVERQLDVTKRRNELSERNIDVAKAQEKFNQAVAGYGRDSIQAKEAQIELDEAQRNVEQSGYRVERSIFAIKEAEEALKGVRMDSASTAQDIRKAEIDLAEAKLDLADAQANQFELNKEQNESLSKLNQTITGAVKGSEVYEELIKELTDAQEAQLAATEALAQASQDLVDAQDAVTDAAQDIIEAREAAEDAARNLLDAEQSLADAIRAVFDAQQAIVDAEQAVVDANEAIAEAHDKIRESVENEAQAYRDLEKAIRQASRAADKAGKPFVAPVMTSFPNVPTPTGGGGGSGGQSDPSVQVVVNTGLGTNGIEAGRQIVEVLQQYSRIGGNNFLEFAVA